MEECNNGHCADYRNHDIQLTVKYLRHLMRELDIPLEQLLRILCIPKKERNTYIKIFNKQLPKAPK